MTFSPSQKEFSALLLALAAQLSSGIYLGLCAISHYWNQIALDACAAALSSENYKSIYSVCFAQGQLNNNLHSFAANEDELYKNAVVITSVMGASILLPVLFTALTLPLNALLKKSIFRTLLITIGLLALSTTACWVMDRYFRACFMIDNKNCPLEIDWGSTKALIPTFLPRPEPDIVPSLAKAVGITAKVSRILWQVEIAFGVADVVMPIVLALINAIVRFKTAARMVDEGTGDDDLPPPPNTPVIERRLTSVLSFSSDHSSSPLLESQTASSAEEQDDRHRLLRRTASLP